MLFMTTGVPLTPCTMSAHSVYVGCMFWFQVLLLCVLCCTALSKNAKRFQMLVIAIEVLRIT